jgi:hypothetical protein
MPEQRKKLPALVLPPEGYQLIRSFARKNDMSISEAIRQLLKESPRLIEHAQEIGVSLDMLTVNTWGGQRGKAEGEEE